MTRYTLVLYLLEMGRTNDILPSAILWYIEKIGSNMYVTGQTAVTWVSPFPQWTEKVEMQNSNRSQTIWFYHTLIKGKDQNLLRVLAWRFGKCWSIGFLNTGNRYGADTWERNRKGGEFLFYGISPALSGGFFTTEPTGKPQNTGFKFRSILKYILNDT